MNLISRFSATVLAGVDKTVSHIENHDAVVEASLKESQRAAAQARVRLQRVTRDGDAMRKKLEQLEQKIQHWTERARVTHSSDRELALQCMARRKQCLAEQADTVAALDRHAVTEQQMIETITQIERRVATISNERNKMRSRQSTAEALRVINKIENSGTGGLDDTFERWDLTISETEISAGSMSSASSIDSLDVKFTAREEQLELETELDALITNDDMGDSAENISRGQNQNE